MLELRPMPTLMLVDDNPDDIRITRRALAKLEIDAEIVEAYNGEQALQMLLEAGRPGAALKHLPTLVLLDINMPRMNGLELLERVRETPALRAIPIVMLTTSALPSDIDAAYSLGANTYVQKPMSFDALLIAIGVLRDYWMVLARLPGAA